MHVRKGTRLSTAKRVKAWGRGYYAYTLFECWHSDPYIFLHFAGNVFCLVSVIFWGVTYVL